MIPTSMVSTTRQLRTGDLRSSRDERRGPSDQLLLDK
jgi:hypothetical protein